MSENDGDYNTIILMRNQPIRAEHNIKGITILRKLGGMYAVEKDSDEILDADLVESAPLDAGGTK